MFSSLQMHRASVVQVFYFSLTELGMAFVAALSLFTISFLGCITVFFVAPSSTASLARRFQDSLETAIGEAATGTSPTSYIPHVVITLQKALQILLIISLLISALGMWVLGDSDRRRPGKWLTGYALLVSLLGLVVLYWLLRVFLGGQLSVWESTSFEFLNTTLGKLNRQGHRCVWEYAHPCSGLSLCCVTNTSAVDVKNEDLLHDEELWRSLCFVTMQNGTAVRRRRSNDHGDALEDVTTLVKNQCGVIDEYLEFNEEYPLYTTACSLANGSVQSTSPLRTSCGDYFIGHLSPTISFNLFLMFCMTVCSFVSGFVILTGSYQRLPASYSSLLDASDVPVNEGSLATKEEACDDFHVVNRKRNCRALYCIVSTES
ncbi:hypothetical protein JKF63_02031 [Porcisia hertigi]|uniref:Uncharacterized protein n=1 Tax=Porcisia hertigi TaxID=2761500 RepID=A0A836HNT5_9TRYP|nr:hypothetical protein JKF63_02031 [Porcisia hertigi]